MNLVAKNVHKFIYFKWLFHINNNNYYSKLDRVIRTEQILTSTKTDKSALI